MQRIYLVSVGSYSDYSILAVFSKESVAKEFVDCYNAQSGKYADEPIIEEHLLDMPQSSWVLVDVWMDKKGNTINTHKSYGEENSGFHWFTSNSVMLWSVFTTDEKRAIKVVNEKRAQILALGIWGDEEKVKVMI